MEFLFGMLLLAVGWFVISKMMNERAGLLEKNQRHCMTCGTDAAPKRLTKGSTGIELILWLCLIVPGLIYSVWRVSSREDVCSACGGKQIVPMDSPAAVKHRETLK